MSPEAETDRIKYLISPREKDLLRAEESTLIEAFKNALIKTQSAVILQELTDFPIVLVDITDRKTFEDIWADFSDRLSLRQNVRPRYPEGFA